MVKALSYSQLSMLLLLLPTHLFSWTPVIQLVDSLALPASELVNRRKSPALWRQDLQEENDPTTTDDNLQPTQQQRRPLLRQPPEVMAPAGGWPQLHAAIANGADAVYVGLSSFSARARAANFDPHELPQAVQTCHDHGVKLYVALNTLVFPNELHPEVEFLLQTCDQAQVDAVIVQDLGVARLAAQAVPNLQVHASTQQSITSADGALFAARVGHATRVVLGRELSVAEIDAVTHRLEQEALHDNQNNNVLKDNNNIHHPVEVEAFVHGALCVSYSGQCFSSEAWGGRSANRGQCAQACRLPYGLVDGGQLVELGDFSYLLSPQDLCGLDHVPDLLQAGVTCLKIEGRLKDAAYVAATTRAYRNAVDRAWEEYLLQEQQGLSNEQRDLALRKTQLLSVEGDVSRQELAQLFSRGQDEANDGLSPGFFDGSQHQRLVRGRSPRHRGVHVGRVMEGSSWKQGLLIALDVNDNAVADGDDSIVEQLKRGDGIVVDRGLAQEDELGGPIFDVQVVSRGASKKKAAKGKQQQNDEQTIVRVRFSKGVEKKWKELDDKSRKLGVAMEHAPVGAHVWKTSDATVDKKMKRFVEAPPPRKLANVQVTGHVGAPLELTIRDAVTGVEGIGRTDGTLESAEKSGISHAAIQKAIGTLGNTDWSLGDIDMSGLEDGVWCPASWIKEARRKAVEQLRSHPTALDTDTIDNKSEFEEGQELMTEQILQALAKDDTALGAHNKLDESDQTDAAKTVKISVLARNYNQVDTLCTMVERGDVAIDEIIVDFLEVDGMREAVTRIRETGSTKVVVASPRIIKPGESGIWRTLLRLEPDCLLVRSAGLLFRMMKLGGAGARVNVGGTTNLKEEHMVTVPEVIGDFSLNVANALTAWELLQYGCSRVTASYDLNSNGITELLHSMGGIGANQVEIVVHAHLPIFHTEHCVFARFLSTGNSYLDCGHACTRHNIHLRDQSGADNLVLADMGCRNTVFASEAQSGAHSLKEWVKAGATHFRIELVDEGSDDVELIVNGYQAVLDRRMRASELWESLEDVRDSNGRSGGVSLGSLRNTNVRRAGEIQ